MLCPAANCVAIKSQFGSVEEHQERSTIWNPFAYNSPKRTDCIGFDVRFAIQRKKVVFCPLSMAASEMLPVTSTVQASLSGDRGFVAWTGLPCALSDEDPSSRTNITVQNVNRSVRMRAPVFTFKFGGACLREQSKRWPRPGHCQEIPRIVASVEVTSCYLPCLHSVL